MDFGGNIFCLSNGNNREQNGCTNNNNNNHSATFAWDSWQHPSSTIPNHSRLINTFYATPSAAESPATTRHEAGLENALMFLPQASSSTTTTTAVAHDDGVHSHEQQQVMYSGDGSHLHPDPHLMCLKLGKRHYFEDANGHPGDRHVAGDGGLSLAGKKGKGYYYGSGGGGAGVKASSFSAATVPRCQVEGCHVALLNAKDYHRRHKVCEMHSKAPKVVVLGLEQRFCQQCSRFHVVSEFDDSKRSCRRRLAGHNERRRKSSQDSVTRNSSEETMLNSILGTPQGKFKRRLECSGGKGGAKVNPWIESMRASSTSRVKSTLSVPENQEKHFWNLLHPSALQMFDQLTHKSKGKQIVVFLDYDGTLSLIVADPDRAFMSKNMRATVKDIARHFPTAIVSGRSTDKVYNFVKLAELYYAGSHGMDIKGPTKTLKKGNQAVLLQPASQFLPMIDEMEAQSSQHVQVVEINRDFHDEGRSFGGSKICGVATCGFADAGSISKDSKE